MFPQNILLLIVLQANIKSKVLLGFLFVSYHANPWHTLAIPFRSHIENLAKNTRPGPFFFYGP